MGVKKDLRSDIKVLEEVIKLNMFEITKQYSLIEDLENSLRKCQRTHKEDVTNLNKMGEDREYLLNTIKEISNAESEYMKNQETKAFYEVVNSLLNNL